MTSIFHVCPGLLLESYNSYSPRFLKAMFDGKKVSPILRYHAPTRNEDEEELYQENRRRISISGVQEKLSLVLEKGQLRLTEAGEQGTYILKPIPRDLKKVKEVPANEHLTMQIAQQVYSIPTATNGLVFFADGEPAYLTRRFDVRPDGGKWAKEDFASLAGKSGDQDGPDFKYESSYEEMAALVRQYVPAWQVEMEKFFSLVVFNYLFSNGDAHLKNFALLETPNGDYQLSPAYDLINTRIHVADTDFGLNKGLFADDFKSAQLRYNALAAKADFEEFGKRAGLATRITNQLLVPFLNRQPAVEQLVRRSFLSDPIKRAYLMAYNRKLKGLTAK